MMDIEERAREIVAKSHYDPMEVARAMVKVARQHAALGLVLRKIVERHPELRREIDGIVALVQQAHDEQES
jgi:hypothetical protein